VVLKPVSANTTGADVVVATVTVAGITRTAEQVVQFVGSAVPTTPVLLLSLSTSTITPQVPATVSLQLLDGSQQPVAGAVVSLATTRPSLGVLGRGFGAHRCPGPRDDDAELGRGRLLRRGRPRRQRHRRRHAGSGRGRLQRDGGRAHDPDRARRPTPR
jgi:hypothetical protein